MRRLLVLILMLAASAAGAAEATRLSSGEGSAVVLSGSSNVAAWQCRGTSIDAAMGVAVSIDHINAVIDRVEDGNIGVWMANPAAGRFPPPQFRLRIPVSTFRCGNRIMESDMRTALKVAQHPHVEFVFREMRGGIQHDLDSGLYHATIAGDLSLAGVTRPIELTLSAERLSPALFRFRAELPLRMTDFGITPPAALFGAIRARDALAVQFDLKLKVAGKG